MTVPPGLFAPGGQTGLAKEKITGVIPIDWLEAHVATRRWMGKSARDNVAAAEIRDIAVDLDDGFEGIVQRMVLLNKANTQGANAGIGWRLYFDRVPVFQTHWQFGAVLDQSGRFDYLHEDDGFGTSWGQINTWIPAGALVEVGMNNNGGTSDTMGWLCWGMYWPISLREEWALRGWRGR